MGHVVQVEYEKCNGLPIVFWMAEECQNGGIYTLKSDYGLEIVKISENNLI